MHRLLIAAASAALLAGAASVALADDYPPCTHKDQDHCRVVGNMDHGRHHPDKHPHHHPAPPKHHHK